MFTSLTEEEVTRLITMRAGRWAADATQQDGATEDGATGDGAPAATDSNAPATTVRRRAPRPDASAGYRQANGDC